MLLNSTETRSCSMDRPKRPQGTDPRIWNLVTQCWAQDPVERPNMEMVLRQLEDMVDSNAPPLHSAGPASRMASGSLGGAASNAADAGSERSGSALLSHKSGDLRHVGEGGLATPRSRLAHTHKGTRDGRGVAGGSSRRMGRERSGGGHDSGGGGDEHGLEPPPAAACMGCSCVIC